MFGYLWLSYIWKIDFDILKESQRKSYLLHRALNRNEPWQHLHLHQGHVTRSTVPYISEEGQERSRLDVEGSTAFLGDTKGHFQILLCPTVIWKLSGMSNWWDKGTKIGPHLLTQYGQRLWSKCVLVNVEIIWLPVILFLIALSKVEMIFAVTGWEWKCCYCSLSVRTVRHGGYGSRLSLETNAGKWNMDRDWSFCCVVPAMLHTTGACISGLVQPRMPTWELSCWCSGDCWAAWDGCCGRARHYQCTAMLLLALILS